MKTSVLQLCLSVSTHEYSVYRHPIDTIDMHEYVYKHHIDTTIYTVASIDTIHSIDNIDSIHSRHYRQL